MPHNRGKCGHGEEGEFNPSPGVEQAKFGVAKVKTVEELRQAQAMPTPLEFGFSLEQTAEAIGVSAGWARRLRVGFIRRDGVQERDRASGGGCRRENLTRDEGPQL